MIRDIHHVPNIGERGEGAACDNKTAGIMTSTAFSSSDGIPNIPLCSIMWLASRQKSNWLNAAVRTTPLEKQSVADDKVGCLKHSTFC